MERDKRKIELLRKRNDELNTKLEEAEARFTELQYNTEISMDRAKELIQELTDLRFQFKAALLRVERCEYEYIRIIEDAKLLKRGAKKPWFSGILNLREKN